MSKRELWESIKASEPELAAFIAAFPGTRILSHKVGDDYLIDSPEGKALRASEAKQEARAAKDAQIERNHFRLVQAQSILRREK